MNIKFFNFLFIFLVFLLISCKGREADENTLIIGTSSDNPPYEFLRNGEIVGLDIDLIKAIAGHMKKKILVKTYGFHELLKALDKNEVDLVISGLSITPQRQARVDFSDSYHISKTVLISRQENAINRKEDLQDKRIGAQLGTIQTQIAKDLSNKYHIRMHAPSDSKSLVEHLKVAKVDAIVVEEEQASKILNNDPSLYMIKLENKTSQFAIAFPLDSKLKGVINNSLRYLMSTGELDKIKNDWLK